MTITEAISLLAGVVGALGAAYTWYSSARKAQLEEQQSEFARMRDLMNLLQDRVRDLTEDYEKMRKERDELLKRVSALERENADLRQRLDGALPRRKTTGPLGGPTKSE